MVSLLLVLYAEGCAEALLGIGLNGPVVLGVGRTYGFAFGEVPLA